MALITSAGCPLSIVCLPAVPAMQYRLVSLYHASTHPCSATKAFSTTTIHVRHQMWDSCTGCLMVLQRDVLLSQAVL